MPKYITVRAGRKLADNQVAILEEHPNHPKDADGNHVVRIIKGDPKFGEGSVGDTPTVLMKLERGELVRVTGGKATDNAFAVEDEDVAGEAVEASADETFAEAKPAAPAARPAGRR